MADQVAKASPELARSAGVQILRGCNANAQIANSRNKGDLGGKEEKNGEEEREGIGSSGVLGGNIDDNDMITKNKTTKICHFLPFF